MHKRRMWIGGLALAAAVGLLCACGCDGMFGDTWRTDTQDVTMAKKGWPVSKVLTVIGRPMYRIEKQDVQMGWEEWVYPTGSIFVYRLYVEHVLPRSEGTPLPEPPKSLWQTPTGTLSENHPRWLKPKGNSNDWRDF